MGYGLGVWFLMGIWLINVVSVKLLVSVVFLGKV